MAVDFVVVGSGAAGLTAALVAATCGLEVRVFEKSALLGGTTSKSGGAVWVPNNPHMREVGVRDSRREALDYLCACTGLAPEDPRVLTLVDRGPAMIRFVETAGEVGFRPWPAVGPTYDYRPWLPGAKRGGRALLPTRVSTSVLGTWAEAVRTDPYSVWTSDPMEYYTSNLHVAAPFTLSDPPQSAERIYGRGTALVIQLARACLAHGVRFYTRVSARDLVREHDRVTGVRVMADGAEHVVAAGAGVLLATGGYSHNRQLMQRWLTAKMLDSCEVEDNQGDGHLMGARAGARMSGLGDAWWMPRSPQPVHGGVPNTGGSKDDRGLPHVLMVNRRGMRFMNEAINYYDAGASFGSGANSDFPAWLVFDQQGVDKYAVLAAKLGVPARHLVVGSSVEELGLRAGIDADTLNRTVIRFNRFALDGVDRDFGRGATIWDLAWGDAAHGPNPSLGTVERPPFYATPVYPGLLATRGGLEVDGRGRVLADAGGAAIDGLYAAGNCSSGGPTGAYPGPGATLGAAMTFAYVAALDVAQRHAERTSLSDA